MRIRITTSQDSILYFDRVLNAMRHDPPLYRELGEELITIHRERFDRAESPSGEQWPSLNLHYALVKSRKKPNAPLLVYNDYLRGQLSYNTLPNGVEFGTPQNYGRKHQYGIGVPKREWLGIGRDDQVRIGEIVLRRISYYFDNLP